MKTKCLLVLAVTLIFGGMAYGDSWTIGGHYLRLNQATPSGNTDNLGVNASYDWEINPGLTFAIEVIASWDNPAELYGGGINMKQQLGCWGSVKSYAGGYVDWFYAKGLPSEFDGVGKDEEGFMWGPLVGLKWPLGAKTDMFVQYQYGFIDGGTLRRAFDEAQWLTFGFEMKF